MMCMALSATWARNLWQEPPWRRAFISCMHEGAGQSIAAAGCAARCNVFGAAGCCWWWPSVWAPFAVWRGRPRTSAYCRDVRGTACFLRVAVARPHQEALCCAWSLNVDWLAMWRVCTMCVCVCVREATMYCCVPSRIRRILCTHWGSQRKSPVHGVSPFSACSKRAHGHVCRLHPGFATGVAAPACSFIVCMRRLACKTTAEALHRMHVVGSCLLQPALWRRRQHVRDEDNKSLRSIHCLCIAVPNQRQQLHASLALPIIQFIWCCWAAKAINCRVSSTSGQWPAGPLPLPDRVCRYMVVLLR